MSASNTSPIGEGAVPVICLTAVESALFSRLKQFAQHWNSSREQSGGVPCVMRVCGGWVRDKLLHKDNDDIDICLDTCSGQQFTTELKAWYDSSGLQSLCSSVGIVKASSEKSKHLETAIIRVTVTGEGVPPNTVLSLDFVQLRCETYAEHSRHPEVGVATPEQDAFRRDFTVNAMFYNIQDETVEDFTGNGIRDLRLGVLRTPIDPVQTLRDDPLRALRAIRFMGRFNFTLDQSLRDALNDVEVKRKLLEIISRERIGEEVLGMFKGPSLQASPLSCFATIHSCGLWQEVFGSGCGASWGDGAMKLLSFLPRDCKNKQLIIAVFTLPLGLADERIRLDDQKGVMQSKKSRTSSAVGTCVLDVLKWPRQEMECAQAIHDGIFALERLCSDSRSIHEIPRSEIAFALRVIPSRFSDYAQLALQAGQARAHCDASGDGADLAKTNFLQKWELLLQRIQDLELLNPGNVCSEICLVDGKRVAELLRVEGRLIAASIQLILQWQFDNPGCTKEALEQAASADKQKFTGK